MPGPWPGISAGTRRRGGSDADRLLPVDRGVRPSLLLEQARAAERAGFQALWISDHFHPWNDAQGQSPFVWSMIGALSQACRAARHDRGDLPDHADPSGDHRAGRGHQRRAARRPLRARRRHRRGAQRAHPRRPRGRAADVRLDMLEEAVEIIRELWTGEFVTTTASTTRSRTPGSTRSPSSRRRSTSRASGPRRSSSPAGSATVTSATAPDAEMLRRFRDSGGADKPCAGRLQGVLRTSTEEDGAASWRTSCWPTTASPASCRRCCRRPRHFEQAADW